MKFVLILCGEENLYWLNLCLDNLKRNTSKDIIVIHNGVDNIKHDNKIEIKSIDDNLKQNRLIKTSITNWIKDDFCYIDNDVIAINNVDNIFNHFKAPITFATDHVVTVDHFSPWAVKNGKLQDAILQKFKIKVDPNWSLWNGGVFLGNQQSEEFFKIWNEYTNSVFDDPNWENRDQGSLVATVWKLGLQNHARLPVECNWISQHTSLIHGATNFQKVKMIHFIHKGKGTDTIEFNQVMTK